MIMDPLTIAGSCIGLLGTITKLAFSIRNFVGQIRDARTDMDAVSQELASLSLRIQMLSEDSSDCAIQYPSGLEKNILAVLRNCDLVAVEMETLLERMAPKNLGRKIRWAVSGRDDMEKLRSRLQAHKTSIEIALEVTSLYAFINHLHFAGNQSSFTN
jgi:hypothetical protein